MKKIVLVYAVALVGIISFVFIGCSKEQADMPTMEMQTQNLESQAQLNAESLTEKAVLQTAEPSVAVPAGTETTAMQPSYKPSAEEIQAALKNAGYYTGAIDGKLGPKSKKAIESFQKDNGLAADGKVGAKTWAKLLGYLNINPAQKTGD